MRCCAESGFGELRIAVALCARDLVAVKVRFGSDRLFKLPRAEFSSGRLPAAGIQGRSLSGLMACIEDAMRLCEEEGFGEVVIDLTPSRNGMIEAVIKRATTVKFFFTKEGLGPLTLPT
jgi:hypothetical protein